MLIFRCEMNNWNWNRITHIEMEIKRWNYIIIIKWNVKCKFHKTRWLKMSIWITLSIHYIKTGKLHLHSIYIVSLLLYCNLFTIENIIQKLNWTFDILIIHFHDAENGTLLQRKLNYSNKGFDLWKDNARSDFKILFL